MALWPVMGMLDRISEHAVTICMLGSYRWNNNASKSCSHTHTHSDDGPVADIYRDPSFKGDGQVPKNNQKW